MSRRDAKRLMVVAGNIEARLTDDGRVLGRSGLVSDVRAARALLDLIEAKWCPPGESYSGPPRMMTVRAPKTEVITEAEILAGLHDYDDDGKCRRCGRLCTEVMNSRSPSCKGAKKKGAA